MVEPWVVKYLNKIKEENNEDVFQEPEAEEVLIGKQTRGIRGRQEGRTEDAEETEEEKSS